MFFGCLKNKHQATTSQHTYFSDTSTPSGRLLLPAMHEVWAKRSVSGCRRRKLWLGDLQIVFFLTDRVFVLNKRVLVSSSI